MGVSEVCRCAFLRAQTLLLLSGVHTQVLVGTWPRINPTQKTYVFVILHTRGMCVTECVYFVGGGDERCAQALLAFLFCIARIATQYFFLISVITQSLPTTRSTTPIRKFTACLTLGAPVGWLCKGCAGRVGGDKQRYPTDGPEERCHTRRKDKHRNSLSQIMSRFMSYKSNGMSRAICTRRRLVIRMMRNLTRAFSPLICSGHHQENLQIFDRHLVRMC